jgi:hypothetical protein
MIPNKDFTQRNLTIEISNPVFSENRVFFVRAAKRLR